VIEQDRATTCSRPIFKADSNTTTHLNHETVTSVFGPAGPTPNGTMKLLRPWSTVVVGLLLPQLAFSFHYQSLLTQSKSCVWGLSQKHKCGVQPMLKMAGTAQGNERPMSKLRLIQHKKEAFWFYRFLSIVYDHVVNPGHWTEDMRKESLKPAKLEWPNLDTVDVGGGTGFCTIGIIKEGVKPENIVMIDQSPHQLEKARWDAQYGRHGSIGSYFFCPGISQSCRASRFSKEMQKNCLSILIQKTAMFQRVASSIGRNRSVEFVKHTEYCVLEAWRA
jgi:hypothetical protein